MLVSNERRRAGPNENQHEFSSSVKQQQVASNARARIPQRHSAMCLGGLVDDIKEAGSAILGCFCCFMCAGPVLVVVGVAFLVSSLTDTRGIKIEQYENQLSFYNTKGWAFEGQDLWVQAHASTNAGVMTGSNGWQDVGKMAQWDAAKSNAAT